MKQSAFNSMFMREGATGEEAVVYNSLTGAVAHLGPEGVAALKGAKTADPGLVAELQEARFLVDDSLDEHEWLSAQFLEDMNHNDFLALCIVPTMECNLRCPYCYEEHEDARMTSEVEDGIMRLVKRRHDAFGIKRLNVVWYGGEPTLEMEVVERLSARMQEWCDANGAEYSAQLVSNATLVDDDVARRLADAGVRYAMPTIDGCASCHDARRVHADGRGSFDETVAGVEALAKAGIEVGAACNLERSNIDGFRTMRERFADAGNVSMNAAHLRNYHGWHDALRDAGDEAAGAFDLLGRKEFAEAQFELYAEQDPSAAGVYEALRSRRMFCMGKLSAYFGVDPDGNVVRCDGHMRDADWRLFNVLDDDYPLDWPEERSFIEKNPRCGKCAIAPTCLGQCDWEWEMLGENCSPLKYTLGKYVWLLRDKLAGDATDLPEVCVLVPPRDVESERAGDFCPLDERGLM